MADEDFSPEDKQELVQKINSGLPKDKMLGLLDVIKGSPTYTGDTKNIKLDLDKLDSGTLKKIKEYLA